LFVLFFVLFCFFLQVVSLYRNATSSHMTINQYYSLVSFGLWAPGFQHAPLLNCITGLFSKGVCPSFRAGVPRGLCPFGILNPTESPRCVLGMKQCYAHGRSCMKIGLADFHFFYPQSQMLQLL